MERQVRSYRIPLVHGVSTERSKNINQPPKMDIAELGMSGTDRREAGLIITAREQTSDRRWVLHRGGAGALEAICDQLDKAEGDWRVLTISTPVTIYRDLQGTRKPEWLDHVHHPEGDYLKKIGRMDLLDPFFDPSLRRGTTHF